MKIVSIKLKNFRGFQEINIVLDGQSAIFFGINGVGKSSVLRAVDLIYANVIKRLLEARRPLAEMNEDDIYDNKEEARAEIEFEFSDGTKCTYWRAINKNGKKTHKSKDLDTVINVFSKNYLSVKQMEDEGNVVLENNKPMPIFVNYGVNRAVIEPSSEVLSKQYIQLDAFDRAIESRIDFKSFFSWFRQTEDIENQLIAQARTQDGEKREKFPVLEAVRGAMLAMFQGFTNVRVDRQKNTFLLEKNNETLNINQLSDGEKCTIALFGDIARRMAIANNDMLSDPLCGEGVVLVDEVDLHLHPVWQRKIVTMLQKIFPNVQFLFTTHSPQVLSEIDEKKCRLFSLGYVDESIKLQQLNSMYGWDTNIILEEAMNTTSVPEEIRKRIERMYKAYEENNLEVAEKEADYIDEITAGHNDCISSMRIMIARKRRGMQRETNI